MRAAIVCVSIFASSVALADEAPPKLAKADPERESPPQQNKAEIELANAKRVDNRNLKLAELGLMFLASLEKDPQRVDEGLIAKMMPPGWRVELDELPGGVVAMAVGPAGKTGSPVVLLSSTGSLPPAETWTNEDARGVLAGSLPGAMDLTRIVPAGLLGGPEIFAERATKAADPLIARYLFTPPPGKWMLTIVAPKSQFASVYGRIAAVVAAKADIAPGEQ